MTGQPNLDTSSLVCSLDGIIEVLTIAENDLGLKTNYEKNFTIRGERGSAQKDQWFTFFIHIELWMQSSSHNRDLIIRLKKNK